MSAPAPAGDPRRVALEVLRRVAKGAWVNPTLASCLACSGMAERDRAFTTALVSGAVRMSRACDWLVDQHLRGPVGPTERDVLRLGAFQLRYLGVPAHAAVSTSVSLSPPRARGLVNAVLRRVATMACPAWPDEATALSYPSWLFERLARELGREPAVAVLSAMNQPVQTPERDDGYRQDPSSLAVAELLSAGSEAVVIDLCAAPGGKATALSGAAGRGPLVLAHELWPGRARRMAGTIRRLGTDRVRVVISDSRHPPLRRGSASHVLLDAPCSGLGALRRRPDARWRVDPGAPERLARVQRELLEAASDLLAPGGELVYSVCTLTAEETVDHDAWLARAHPELEADRALPPPWRPLGRGGRVTPDQGPFDGMFVLRLRRRSR